MMKHLTSFSFLIFIFGLILSPTLEVNAAAPGSETGGIQQAEPTDQDREYCASMIRFGKEAFQWGALPRCQTVFPPGDRSRPDQFQSLALL